MTVVVFFVSTIMAWHLVSGRTWSPLFSEGLPDNDYGRGPFFTAQAQGLLRGDLAVAPETLYGECYYVGESCFGYFGLTPSLLRLPWVLTGSSLDLTSVSMLAGLTVGIGASLSLFALVLRRYAPRPEDWGLYGISLFLIGLLVFGPGNLLFQVTDSSIFSEAVVWGTALTVCTALFAAIWIGDPRLRWLWLAVGSSCLAASARPTAGIAAIGIALVLALYMSRHRTWSRARFVAIVLLGFLPMSLLILSYMWKFGSPTPDLLMNESIAGQGPLETRAKWLGVIEANGGTTASIQFLPSHLWAALRPDAVAINFHPPRNAFFTQVSQESFAFIPPTPVGGLYIQPTGSLTALTTGPLLLTVIAVVGAVMRPAALRGHLRLLVMLALGSGLGLAITWTTVGVANRYLLDAWALLVLGGSIGIALLSELKPTTRLGSAVTVVAIAAFAGYGVVVSRMVTGI